MPSLTHNRIVMAIPDPTTLTVQLVWENGSKTRADFAPLLGRGLFAAFADPNFFEGAEVIDGGHVLAWSGELEFDADALWFEAHPEDSPDAAALSTSRQ